MNQLQLTYHDPRALKENPWNPNHVDAINEEKLANSIDEFGMFRPIICRQLEDGSLEILGGQHRNRVAMMRGIDSVPVLNLGAMDDNKAKKIGLVDNGRYGEDNLEELAKVFADLGSPEDIVNIMPIDLAEFENIFVKDEDMDLDYDDLMNDGDESHAEESAQAELDINTSVRTHQVMRFKVAVDDAPHIESFLRRIQREQGFIESDSLTNAGDALVFALGTHPEFRND